MLRSTLIPAGPCIYAMTWSPSSEHILYTSGKDLVLKPLQPALKQSVWTAHESPVIAVDWNLVNNLIISGGEDCKYKLWDSYGRLLFQSHMFDQHITSVSWRPDGDLFAVGSYNTLLLCDKTGVYFFFSSAINFL